jgi:hypothetical protein
MTTLNRNSLSSSKLLLALVLAAAFTVDVSAQPKFFNAIQLPAFDLVLSDFCLEQGPGGSHSINVGNSWAGATGSLAAGAKYRCGSCAPKSARAFVEAKVTAKLLKQSIQAFDAQASARVTDGQPESKLYVKIGPSTLINQTAPTIQWSRNKKITLISASQRVMVGPIPIKISGSLAAVLNANLKLEANGSTYKVRSSGELTASLEGTASGAVDVVVASAGLEAVLKVLKAKLSGDYGVEDCSAFGLLKVCFDPVDIALKAFAKVNIPCFPDFWNNCPKKYSTTLVRWTAGSFCKDLVKA